MAELVQWYQITVIGENLLRSTADFDALIHFGRNTGAPFFVQVSDSQSVEPRSEDPAG